MSKNWNDFDRAEDDSGPDLNDRVRVELPVYLRKDSQVRRTTSDVIKDENLDADDDVIKQVVEERVVQDEPGRSYFRFKKSEIPLVRRQLPGDVEAGIEDGVESGLVTRAGFITRPKPVTEKRNQQRAVVALALVAVHHDLLQVGAQPLGVDVESHDSCH